MNTEIIAFELENACVSRSERPWYDRLAQDLRDGNEMAIEVYSKARDQRQAASNYHCVQRAQFHGLTDIFQYNKYGWINYHHYLLQFIIQEVRLDIHNDYKIFRLPAGKFIYDYGFSVNSEGSYGGRSIYEDGFDSLVDCKRDLCQRALNFFARCRCKSARSKRLAKHYEDMLRTIDQPVGVQLSLFSI